MFLSFEEGFVPPKLLKISAPSSLENTSCARLVSDWSGSSTLAFHSELSRGISYDSGVTKAIASKITFCYSLLNPDRVARLSAK
jgi:hypothetical protein